jgi:membrane protease YdiL (CAAX protease family)
LTTAQLLIVHCAIGVPLSLGWRRTGRLVAPALAHALIDAVRNALLTGL